MDISEVSVLFHVDFVRALGLLGLELCFLGTIFIRWLYPYSKSSLTDVYGGTMFLPLKDVK